MVVLQRSVFLLVAMFAAGPVFAVNVERGKALYENHCVSCHDDTVHRREAHKAANFADIEKFVARWEKELKLKWSAEERADVASFVNEKYYNY
ncbi:MAG: cytochrome c [Gammaproteobacteria bacterium]|nr:cytochrome c [Gammaproteobacteria bacterium]